MSKTLAEMIAVMQAAERGEEIESRSRLPDATWTYNPFPSWQWETVEFRVKPQPKVIWVNEYVRHLYAYTTEAEAKENAGANTTRKLVKYVEAQD